MAVELTDAQRRTLSALADTYVAAVPPPDGERTRTASTPAPGSEAGAPGVLEIGLTRIDPVRGRPADAAGRVRRGGLRRRPGGGTGRAIVDAVAGSSPEARRSACGSCGRSC